MTRQTTTHPGFQPTGDQTADVAAHFDEFAENYHEVAFAGAGMAELAARDAALLDAAVAAAAPGRACDVGVGTGRIVGHLLDCGYDVTGFDISAEMRARTTQRFPNVTITEGALPGPLDAESGKFQLVTSLRVIKYVEQWPAAIAELARLASEDGIVCFDLVNRRSLARFGYPRGLVHAATFAAAEDAIRKAGLSVVAVHPGVHIPDPLWRRASGERANNAVNGLELITSAVIGKAGARSWGFVTRKVSA